ncbi:MAG: ABC transporter ATP-binding protein [Acidobacteria bacterium]|nr:ABC transporter ATP-binding protein [Acidobacteriota bacterium]
MSGTTIPAKVERLEVRYGGMRAVADVSFEVRPGAVHALLGRNGAGKSSLIRCLLGQRRPDGGRALLFGEDAWTSRTRLMQRVGVVPEEPDAPPESTVSRLVSFCARLYRSWDGPGVEERLRRFAVPREVPFGRLSKGQKGQVMLALALGHRPELLVLDDPTLGLDVVARKVLYEELVGELADRGTTVFLTTHDLAGIEGIADRVAIVRDGELVLDEELEALKGRFRRLRFAAREQEPRLDALGAVAVSRSGWGVDAVVSRWDDGAAGRWCQGGGAVAEPVVEAMSLEEIFTAMVGGETGGAQ